MWAKLKAFFSYSETIFLARVQMFAAIVFGAFMALDPSLFQAYVPTQYVPLYLLGMSYAIAIEKFSEAWPELEPLCRTHYGEMQARMAGEGMRIGDFKPRVNVYASAPHLLCFVVRTEGEAIGYAFIWVTEDMHNSELIGMEDTIYIRPDHRNGIGRRFTKHILAELKARGCQRAHVTIATDLRVAKMCERVGFKRSAIAMTYFLQES